MSDHLILCVDRLITHESLQAFQADDALTSSREGSCTNVSEPSSPSFRNEVTIQIDVLDKDPILQIVECRICQEEDCIKNLETPCACSGSLMFAHRKCVQRWCNEKGDITCEICHQPYQPNYSAPPRSEDTVIDMSGGWAISGPPINFHDPRLLAIAAPEHHFFDSDYDEYADPNANRPSIFRYPPIIVMSLLLAMHVLNNQNGDGDDDAFTFFSLFLFRAAGFLLPCYIMILTITILQSRRENQETTGAYTEIVHSEQQRDMQVTIAPVASVLPIRT